MSALEDQLCVHVQLARLPLPHREFRFAPPRRWRWDLCWPERLLAVEVDGGSWVQGRHSRGKGMRADCEKQNAGVLLGWSILHVTSDMVRDGSALNVVEQALR